MPRRLPPSLALLLPLLALGCARVPPSSHGVWNGTWTHAGKIWVNGHEVTPVPIPFDLALFQTHNFLRGRTSEIEVTAHGPGRTLTATADGFFTGAHTLRLVKTFEGEGSGLPAITYTGTLSEDGTRITGEWQEEGETGGRGTFELRRQE